MKDVYDMDSGLFYCAMTSRSQEPDVLDESEHKSSFSQGVAIIASFCLCAAAIVIAI